MSGKKDKIRITYSNREWKIIDKRIRELGSKDYNRYLSKKISALLNDYNNCPDCIIEALAPNKKRRDNLIPSDLYNTLRIVSQKTDIPVSTIVDKLIILPLLIEK